MRCYIHPHSNVAAVITTTAKLPSLKVSVGVKEYKDFARSLVEDPEITSGMRVASNNDSFTPKPCQYKRGGCGWCLNCAKFGQRSWRG